MRGRFASFATVGSLGFILQLGALAFLTAAGWPYLVAAAIAVELAALHNFCWHERWTWCDRVLPRCRVGRRLLDYHLTTASIAVAGNVVLTGAIVEISGAPPLLANVAAVAILAMVSFRVADRWVYVDAPKKRPSVVDWLDEDARRRETIAEPGAEDAGTWSVAVNTQGVDRDRQRRAIDRHDHALNDHPHSAVDDSDGIGEHRSGCAPPGERAIALVSSIRERLRGNAKPSGPPCLEQFRVGRGEQRERRIKCLHGANDGGRQIAIPSRHVVEGAMRLHVMERDTFRARHARDSRDLVQNQVFGLRCAEAHLAPPEAVQVGKAGMSADPDAVFSRELNRAPKNGGIAAVKTGREAG